MPGLVAFSGDSMVRGLFGEVVGLLRRGPLYYDAVTGAAVDADPTGTPTIHSRSLYVRFADVDVYISNMLGFLETSPETSHPDVRRAYWAEAEAMLADMLAANATATTTDMVRFLVEVARPLAREHGSQPEGTLRFVARALRALCDANKTLCPVLVLTYEFDQMAERPLTSHMPTEAAEAFLALRSQHGLGYERLGALPEHAPVEDLVPISVHLYSHGMQGTGDGAVAARQLTRFLLPARGLSPATAPILIQRLASGYVNRNHAVPVGLDFIRAERAARRMESAAIRTLTQAPPPSTPPLSSAHWSRRRRVLAVGPRSVESAHLSSVGVVPATHTILRSLQVAKTPTYMYPPPPPPPTTPAPPPLIRASPEQVPNTSRPVLKKKKPRRGRNRGSVTLATAPPPNDDATTGTPTTVPPAPPLPSVPELLSLHLPPRASALEPLQLVPVTTATRDAVAAVLGTVRSHGLPHFGESSNPGGHAGALHRGTSLLTLLRQLHAFAAELHLPPATSTTALTTSTTTTSPPPMTTDAGLDRSHEVTPLPPPGALPLLGAMPEHTLLAPRRVFPAPPPPPPPAASAFAAGLASVVAGGPARLRQHPALTAAVIGGAYVYDAMLLQSIFPFSGADAIHVNTMLLFQREASLNVANANRLGCAAGDCARQGLGAFPAMLPAVDSGATSATPGAQPIAAPPPLKPAAQSSSSTMYALTGGSSNLVMGHLHSAFLQTTAPRPAVVEEDSEENAAAEARVLAVAMQGNVILNTPSVGVSSPSTTSSTPPSLTVPPPPAPTVLAAFFNERFPVDMLVGSGCDHIMLGRARMLHPQLTAGQTDEERQSASGEGATSKTSTMATRINARLHRDGPSAAPRLLEQTPGCAHTFYFSHSIGGRNPMQRLELALLLAHLAAE